MRTGRSGEVCAVVGRGTGVRRRPEGMRGCETRGRAGKAEVAVSVGICEELQCVACERGLCGIEEEEGGVSECVWGEVERMDE